MVDQKKRLKKLYALALRGIDGEKAEAEVLLNKLLKKYSISIEELNEDEIKDFEMEYHGEEQKTMLKQIVYKVTDNSNACSNLRYVLSGRKCKTRINVECTPSQKVEIDFLFDFYKRIWENEKSTLLRAFIQKHRLFGSLKEGESGDELPPEEFAKLSRMMFGLSNDEPYKALNS